MLNRKNFRRSVVNVLDCDIVVSDFEYQLRYRIHFGANTFGKAINSLIPLAMS